MSLDPSRQAFVTQQPKSRARILVPKWLVLGLVASNFVQKLLTPPIFCATNVIPVENRFSIHPSTDDICKLRVQRENDVEDYGLLTKMT